MRNLVDMFTTNEQTTDGEILDRVFELVASDRQPEQKIYLITLLLEYAKEDNL